MQRSVVRIRALAAACTLALAGVLSVGLGWAKARQKLTGQVEVD